MKTKRLCLLGSRKRLCYRALGIRHLWNIILGDNLSQQCWRSYRAQVYVVSLRNRTQFPVIFSRYALTRIIFLIRVIEIIIVAYLKSLNIKNLIIVHVFETPEPRKKDGLPPVLSRRRRSITKLKVRPRQHELHGEVTHVQKLRPLQHSLHGQETLTPSKGQVGCRLRLTRH